ncbi:MULTISPECIES: malto-oligosyltrehalose trehalohydrolase [unclassified Rhizobium]|uniref:malto-oligosyltrehalose trehalohydrolase n=1 Tax=unclassified Rhizobium TaxID=2613769 RepID=UPI0006FEE521|nr:MULTISPECIES: malto-oligosyltrehalose trehalohydrolase [unclassified Rhizobium]KQV38923.1 malto-oligosyltrehalose trehalohydrolase [Rhizobium sp. Root1212]KRD34991.1 malto-oligosyltrehalose trehalohydrolase [Rhizobium sp. Root268]
MIEYAFGPLIDEHGVEFRLWAPLKDSVHVRVEGRKAEPMEPNDNGWHRCRLDGLGPGSRYKFVMPDGSEVPDPGSRHQPHDVHGPSEVIDLCRYEWKTNAWSGRPWEAMVIYELHIGSFTSEGTFRAAIAKLDHLAVLGITAIQIMPVSEFPGRYNWGYDGVLPYASDSSYGRPEDFMALVDAAHERGISIFLDVVYNHFGPDGNYLPTYAPLFTENHKTPWGNGINYDGEGSRAVREFIIQNAIYWVEEYRLDGLRLDAVHAIKDDSEEHRLQELARRVRDTAGARHVHLIVENEDNDSDLLRRDQKGQAVNFTAQWNDDVHHVLHIAATGETFGYYQDYADDTGKVGRALAEGFVFQGEHMPYRGGNRGKSTDHLPPTAFISFIQNHDQIGNRARGDRMITYRPLAPLKAVTAIYLLSPQIPMLFMGEEWGAREPFPYFCDFDEDLNDKVRKGRREELSRLPGFDADDLLDPTAESTFEVAKLNWSAIAGLDASEMLAFYSSLLALRHQRIVPLLKDIGNGNASFRQEGSATTVDWVTKHGATLSLVANLSDGPVRLRTSPAAEPIFSLGSFSHETLSAWAVMVSLTEPRS